MSALGPANGSDNDILGEMLLYVLTLNTMGPFLFIFYYYSFFFVLVMKCLTKNVQCNE